MNPIKSPDHHSETTGLKRIFMACFLLLTYSLTPLSAVEGPFSPDQWPPTTDASKEVHYVVADPFAFFDPVGANWFNGDLSILSGGDQLTREVTIGGYTGVRTLGNFLNIADAFYFEWGDNEVIDILVQFYGDSAVLTPTGEAKTYNFLTGTLPGGDNGNLNIVSGGTIPVEAKNNQWNWALFRIPNEIRPDGERYVGTPAINAQGAIQSGGVNGGTIRFENVPGLIVRLVAFGEEGAFGEPEQINLFAAAEACEPVPETNHVFNDIANETSDHLNLLNDGDQQVEFITAGPENDRRRAALPQGLYMNFGITEEYLGKPCHDPVTLKICVEYYDDPNLLGAAFGPDSWATDDQGGLEFFPLELLHEITGSGEWRRRSFTLANVNLSGVNTGNLTGGPRLIFDAGSIPVSRVDIGVIRGGDHPLAGVDPLADCYEDPLICSDIYGNFAELDLHLDIQNGIAPGSSGGDQEMIVEEAGPSGDRRMAIRPAFDDGSPNFNHQFLNFALVDEVFGPTSQPNAHLSICVTYYDNPELVGASFRPEVYQVDRTGLVTFGFTSPDIAVELTGSGEWKDAYFEIPEIKFNGVNQGPQAAARFSLSDKIHFTRVRYGIIRPCGPFEGINPLEECKPLEAPNLRIETLESGAILLAWPTASEGFSIQSTDDIAGEWTALELEVEVENEENRITLTPQQTSFYRLAQ